MDKQLFRLLVVLTFSMAFAFIGWSSPVLYATYAPDSSIIEVHDFDAQNATQDDAAHFVCFNRTVHQPAAGKTFTELYLVNEKGDEPDRTEIGFKSQERYYQEGHAEVVTELELPDDLEAGEYRYALVIKMELADGRVVRPFEYTSESFYIKNNTNTTESLTNADCD